MPTDKEPVYPPLDGSVTLPETIEFNSKHNAEQPIFVFNKDGSDEITEITHLEFRRACHRVAHHVRPQRAGSDGEVVAFIALADTILYQAITIGMMRAGVVPFPMSPRNTPAAVVHLLKKTNCHRILTTQVTLRSLIDGIKLELAQHDPDFELVVEEIPPLAEIYPKLGVETEADPFEPYPQYTTRPPMTDLALYLHSSGSTGFPKAIAQTHLIMLHWSSFPNLLNYRDRRPRARVAGMPLPPFHTLGVIVQVLYTLYAVVCVGVYPPIATSSELLPVMPTPENILDHTRRTKCNGMVTIPTLLQVWAQSQEAVDYLKSLHYVGYSGGSLAPKLGNFMSASGVRLYPGYGATEFGSPTVAFPGTGDEWAYMQFGSRAKIRWAPQGDGTYELQFLTNETHCLAVENLPDVRGYATSDLWEPHPTKDYFWKIVGRIDDVIIHSSGEKTVPAPMEDIVMSSPYVMGTVMFGREHDQAGILIEPKPDYAIDVTDQDQLAKLRNKLWPVVEEANKVAPTFSRVFKEMILITSKDKPLPRAAKGTVMRKMALKSYDDEIEAIYATVESTAKAEDVTPPSSWTVDNVGAWLLEQATDIRGSNLSSEADLFEQGFDSLSATILRRRLVGALRATKTSTSSKAAELVTQNTVYSCPTIKALTSFLVDLVADPEGFTIALNGKALIEQMVDKYSAGLDRPISDAARTDPARKVVLLTGSTGNLGAQILASLLEDASVERVYALNRASSGSSILDRHIERFVDKALDVALLTSERLVFVEGDTALSNLGLSEELYNEIRDSVSVVIHNAWKLDFNLLLASFEHNIRGTRHLIDLARAGPYPTSTRFLFTSSVASAQSWNRGNGPFPEEIVADAGVAVGNGYGEGKYVSERILAKSGLQMTSFRIGQISGGMPNGAWATTDWVPILVKSSLALGALPGATGVVSWLPMDAVAKTILDVAFTKEQPPAALNIVHPRPIEWNVIISSIQDALAQDKIPGHRVLPVIPFQDWFASLEKRAKAASDEDLKTIPGIKLLEFYRTFSGADKVITQTGGHDTESGGLSKFATAKAENVSRTMKELTPIGTEDIKRWISYWHAVGLFV